MRRAGAGRLLRDVALVVPVLALGAGPVLHLLRVAWLDDGHGQALSWQLDARALGLLGRSLVIAGSAAAGALVLGLAIGIPLARVRLPGRSGATLLLIGAFAVSPYWMALGWLGGDLASVAAQGLVGSPAAVAGVLAAAYAPAVALLVAFALRSMSIEGEEAAFLVAPLPRVLVGVVLPRLLPVLGVAGLFVFALAFSDHAVASLLQVLTYPVEVFLLQASAFAPGQAARACLPLIAIAAILAFSLARSISRFPRPQSARRVARDWSLGPRERLVGIAIGTVVLLAAFAWPAARILGQVAPGQALEALRTGSPALANSLAVSACAVLPALVLGAAASGPVVRAGPRFGAGLAMLLLLPMCLPGSAFAIAWVELLGWLPPPLRTALSVAPPLAPALCIAARLAGVVALLLAAARLAVPRGAREAALLAESSATRRFLRTELPMVAPVALVAAAIVAALANAAAGTLVLTAPPGFEVAPLRVDNLLHYGAHGQAIALSAAGAGLTMGATLALAIAGGALRRRWA